MCKFSTAVAPNNEPYADGPCLPECASKID